MTREQALERAAALDQRTDREIQERLLDSPSKLLTRIRAYLLRRSDEMLTLNNPIELLRMKKGDGIASIFLGPQIDKGLTPGHFNFDSGARLSFGLTVRERNHGSQLVEFRFHYQLPGFQAPAYFRFDLNKKQHENPLSEPLCHLHPGLEDVRIPITLHDPIEILDRIFFVLEPFMASGAP